MNDDLNDMQLDDALEALAYQEPPPNHVAQVLARTTNSSGDGLAAAGYLRPRWLLPIAATVLGVLGATWQGERQLRDRLDEVMAATTDRSASSPHLRLDPQLASPVLPPEAYWGMDPFAEFDTLRPGSRAASQPERAGARSEAGSRLPALTRATSADDESAWVPVASGLTPIELPSILPAPLVVAPLAALDAIAIAEIAVEPIVIAPLIEEERP